MFSPPARPRQTLRLLLPPVMPSVAAAHTPAIRCAALRFPLPSVGRSCRYITALNISDMPFPCCCFFNFLKIPPLPLLVSSSMSLSVHHHNPPSFWHPLLTPSPFPVFLAPLTPVFPLLSLSPTLPSQSLNKAKKVFEIRNLKTRQQTAHALTAAADYRPVKFQTTVETLLCLCLYLPSYCVYRRKTAGGADSGIIKPLESMCVQCAQ